VVHRQSWTAPHSKTMTFPPLPLFHPLHMRPGRLPRVPSVSHRPNRSHPLVRLHACPCAHKITITLPDHALPTHLHTAGAGCLQAAQSAAPPAVAPLPHSLCCWPPCAAGAGRPPTLRTPAAAVAAARCLHFVTRPGARCWTATAPLEPRAGP